MKPIFRLFLFYQSNYPKLNAQQFIRNYLQDKL